MFRMLGLVCMVTVGCGVASLGQAQDAAQIETWARGLRNDSWGLRAAATVELIGAGGSAVPALTGLLSDGDADVRERAAFVLGRIGAPAASAADALAAMLDDEANDAAQEAIVALVVLDPDRALRELTAHFADDSLADRVPYGLGAVGADAVPALRALLADGDPKIRARAAHAVRYIRGPGRSLVPDLMYAVADADATVRSEALYALACIGEPAALALSTMMGALGDPSADVRRGAASAIESSGVVSDATISALSSALGDEESDVRASVLWTLGSASDERHAEEHGSAAASTLAGCLDDEDAYVRRTALRQIADFGAHAATAVPVMAAVLSDPDTDVRRTAIEALGKLGPIAAPAAPALVAAMGEPQAAAECFTALVAITGQPERYVDPLLDAVWDADIVSLGYGVLALGEVGGGARAALPDLIALLEEQRVRNLIPFLHIALLKGIGDIGPEAGAAIPELQANADPSVAHLKVERAITVWAHYAVAKISDDPEPHVQALISMLSNGDDASYLYERRRSWDVDTNRVRLSVRAAALQALRCLGPMAADAAPEILKALQDTESTTAYLEAFSALQAVAPDSPDTVAALAAAIQGLGKTGPYHFGAHDALKDLGPAASAAVPVLLGELMTPYADMVAAQTLAAIGPASIPGLVDALSAPRASSRYQAAWALGEMGPLAGAARPRLRELADADPSWSVRAAAAEALERIGAP